MIRKVEFLVAQSLVGYFKPRLSSRVAYSQCAQMYEQVKIINDVTQYRGECRDQ